MGIAGGLLEYQIQNKHSAKTRRQIEDEITNALSDGKRVLVQNDADYAVAAVTVVEAVKNRLRSTGTKVYQANRLDYEPVLAPEKPEEPLAKRKTHHYRIKLTTVLAVTPISDMDDATQQETLPTRHKTEQRKEE